MNSVRQGELLRDDGMKRAVDHADVVEKKWSERALGAMKAMAIMHPTLTTETVALWAHGRGLSPPPDPRAWGAVVRTAVVRGYIRPGGFEKSTNPQAHRRPVQVWVSNLHNGG